MQACKECGKPIVEVDTDVWYHIHKRYLLEDGSDDFDRDDLEYLCNGAPVKPMARFLDPMTRDRVLRENV